MRMAGALAPPRARRVRRSTATRAPGSRTRGCRSSISPSGQQPLAERGRPPVDRVQRRDLQLRRAARRARGARPPLPHAQRHRGHRPRLRGVGRATPSRASTASGRSRCGTRVRGALVLARDRLGVRPLYLCEHGGRLYFASEVKAIFAADPSIPRALDPVGLDSDVHVLDRRAAADACSKASTSCEPGHVRTYRARGSRASARSGSRATRLTARVRFTRLARGRGRARCARRSRQATRLRMLRADVPVGSYLSGGLDSSLVAALAARAKRRALPHVLAALRGRRVRRDRVTSALMVAAARQRAPRGRGLARATSPRVFPEVDPPHRAADPAHRARAAVPAVRLVRERGIKVVLTGEGADEMFAGYDLFREGKVRRFWARQPESTLRGRGCSSGSIRISRARRSRSRRWRGSSSAATSQRWRTPGLLARAALAHAPARSSGCSRRAARRGRRTRRRRASCSPRCRRSSRAGRRSRRTSTSRVRTLLVRLSALVAGRSHADGALGRGRFPFLDATWSRSPTRCRRPTSCACSTRSTCSSAPRAGSCPLEILARGRSSPTARPTRCVRWPRRRRDWVEELLSERAVRDAGVFDPRPVAAALGKVPRARRAGSSPTPTTWRSSACSRRSLYTRSSSAPLRRRCPLGAFAPWSIGSPRRTNQRCCNEARPHPRRAQPRAAVHRRDLLRE